MMLGNVGTYEEHEWDGCIIRRWSTSRQQPYTVMRQKYYPSDRHRSRETIAFTETLEGARRRAELAS